MFGRKEKHYRWSRRRPVSLEVTVYDNGLTPMAGEIRNVSIGGVYVDTGAVVPKENASVVLGFRTESGGDVHYHRLPATVVHVEDHGVGLMFQDYDPLTVAALRSVIYRSMDDEKTRH